MDSVNATLMLPARQKPISSAYARFQRLARAIRICMIIKAEPNRQHNVLSDVSHYVTFAEYAEQMRQLSSGLSFNPDMYKANRQLKLATETKKMLSIKQQDRTPAQIQQILLALRCIRSFSEYPKRMQQLLVKVCWHESHGQKKIILRQGHPPTAFYFILSGSVVVKKLSPNQGFAKTVCNLKRGDSFGELSIIHSTVRQATIITESEVELLCISKEDFIRIFMTSASGGKNLHDPDFFTFVKQLDFLKGWPIELLPKNQKDCLFNYFKTGSVLVKDSRFSDWIYIIKSGSCDVLKELKQVKTKNKSRNRDDDKSNSWNTGKESVQQRARTAPTRQPRHFLENRSIGKSPPAAKQQQQQQQEQSRLFVTKIKIQPRPKPNRRSKKKIQPAPVSEANKNQRISVLDSGALEEERYNEGTESSRDKHTNIEQTCFVKIKTIQKGETFGLQHMMAPKRQPSLSLVSNGAEILMISKQFYKAHANSETRQNLERKLMMYPQDGVLQRNLQVEMEWRAYKQNLVERVARRRCKTAHI